MLLLFVGTQSIREADRPTSDVQCQADVLREPVKTDKCESIEKRSHGFTVNILSADQQEISNTFSNPSLAQQDRFARSSFHADEENFAVFGECLAHLKCELNTACIAGDHKIVIGHVIAMDSVKKDKGEPLLHHSGRCRKMAPDQSNIMTIPVSVLCLCCLGQSLGTSNLCLRLLGSMSHKRLASFFRAKRTLNQGTRFLRASALSPGSGRNLNLSGSH